MLCLKYSVPIRLKQYYLSTRKLHLIHSTEKYYFTVLHIYVQKQPYLFAIATYVIPVSLFIIGGKEIMSRKETTQGCLTSMVTCRIGLTPLLDNLQNISSVTKHAVFSDNLAGAEKLLQIKL